MTKLAGLDQELGTIVLDQEQLGAIVIALQGRRTDITDIIVKEMWKHDHPKGKVPRNRNSGNSGGPK